MVSYSIERHFRWKWFSYFAFGGGLIALVIIIVVNVALTGYETVTVFRSDYRTRETHWYDNFRTKEPAPLCDTHIFNVGDTLTTNYTLFAWTLGSITIPNAGDSGYASNGTTLTDCDISSLFITGDLKSWTVSFVVLISCSKHQEFDITASTRFSISSLPGEYSPLLGMARSLEAGGQGDNRAIIIDWLLQDANLDLGNRVGTAFLNSGETNYVVVSLQVDFHHCPLSLGPNASCGISVPSYNVSVSTLVYPNATLSTYSAYYPVAADNQFNIDDDIAGPLNNIIRIIHAAVRVDLGIDSPNNLILHPEVANASLVTTFPITHLNPTNYTSASLLLEWINPTSDIEPFMPVNVSGPAELQVVYLCRLQQRKAAAQLFISVLVATLSMFSSGWALFLSAATIIAKRQDTTANFCEGHCGQGPKNGEVMNASYSSDLRRRPRQKEYELVENIPFEPIEHRPRSVQNVD